MSVLGIIFVIVFIGSLITIIFTRFAIILDYAYYFIFKKPAFLHVGIRRNRLAPADQAFLQAEFPLYSGLSPKLQKVFEHRITRFLSETEIIGREGFTVSRTVELWIAATAVMLSFGMRNYKLPLLNTILIYPNIYYSNINQTYHKGEYNPRLKIMVFSWKHFMEGYHITNDNLNLGIHEFVHAIQINAHKKGDISSVIFTDRSKELIRLLAQPKIRKQLEQTAYFRSYAYTNRFEFLAVLVEYFIENPRDFKQHFPAFYRKIKSMLNFNFEGY